jgi:hypothetical protein
MSTLLTDSPSLANASGTLLNSACKHIQQCRVSFDHMLDFVDSEDQLEKSELRYCFHKDEMVVGVTRPWKKPKTRTLPPTDILYRKLPRFTTKLQRFTTKLPNSKFRAGMFYLCSGSK